MFKAHKDPEAGRSKRGKCEHRVNAIDYSDQHFIIKNNINGLNN
jgi:hypothetical protein